MTIPTLDELKLAERDNHWISEEYAKLKEKYSGNYIFVKNRKVVTSGTSRKEVIEKASKEGVNVQKEGLTEFIPKGNETLIL